MGKIWTIIIEKLWKYLMFCSSAPEWFQQQESLTRDFPFFSETTFLPASPLPKPVTLLWNLCGPRTTSVEHWFCSPLLRTSAARNIRFILTIQSRLSVIWWKPHYKLLKNCDKKLLGMLHYILLCHLSSKEKNLSQFRRPWSNFLPWFQHWKRTWNHSSICSSSTLIHTLLNIQFTPY